MNRDSLLRGVFWIVLGLSFVGLIFASYAIYTRQGDRIDLLKDDLKITHQMLKKTKNKLSEEKGNTDILTEKKENLSRRVSLNESRIEKFRQEKEAQENKAEELLKQKVALEVTLDEARKSLKDQIRLQELKMIDLEKDFQKKSAMEKAMFSAQEEKSNEQIMATEVLLEALMEKNKELTEKAKENKRLLVRLIEENESGIPAYSPEEPENIHDLKKKILSLNTMIRQNEKLIAESKRTVSSVVSEKEKIAKQLQQSKDQYKKEALKFHYNLGLAYDQSGQFKEALEEYKKALEIDGQDADLQYNLAIIYDEHFNDMKKAVEHYSAYLKLSPDAEDKDKVTHWMEEAKRELKFSVQSIKTSKRGRS